MAATCGLEGNEIALLEPSFRQWGMSDSYVVAIPPPRHDDERVSRLADVYRLLGIVKLSGIAMIDPQHTWFATGLGPIILGVGQPDSA